MVYGKAGGRTGTLDTASLGADGFAITEPADSSVFGSSVSGAGDFNGDGIDDIIIGAMAEVMSPAVPNVSLQKPM